MSALSEKDVNRTDRTNRFYEGIDNPGLVLLHDILMTYCMYDFDLGERTLCLRRYGAACCFLVVTGSSLCCRLRSGHERPAVAHPLRHGE